MEQQGQIPLSSNSNPQMENQKTNIMAVISYIGPLCLIPILTQEKDEFTKFHAKQGLVLFIGETAAWFFGIIIPILWPFIWLINIGWFALSIIGIMSAAKNEKKELPVVGKFGQKFNI